MLYAEPDERPEDIACRWRDCLQDRALVRTKDEAIADGLFGPVCERVRPMLGDVVVQAAGAVTLVDSRTQGDKATHLPSVHGSQTALEMDIPCLIDDLRLAGLAGASCSVAADSAARSCSVATSCALGPLRMVLSETLSEPCSGAVAGDCCNPAADGETDPAVCEETGLGAVVP